MLALALVACGGGRAHDVTADVPASISIPGEAVQSLTNYRFKTALTIASETSGTSDISFDGVFEAPSSIQGILSVSGGQYEQFLTTYYRRAVRFEGIAIGNDAWWREPGGEWQPGVKGYEEVDPLIQLRSYATPEFYLEALKFDRLSLPVAGPVEEVDGSRAYRVKLGKSDMIAALQQGRAVKNYPDPKSEYRPVGPGIADNANYNLPGDIAVDAWFSVEGLQPLRIVITYSLGDREFFIVAGPTKLRLQLDITDRSARTHIEAPFPLASPSARSGSPVAIQTPRPAVTRAVATATPSSR